MAESPDAVSETEEAKKKIVLEEKTKEDLIKIVKKQLNLLQKAKGRTEELSRKCTSLEEEKNQAIEKQESVIIGLQQQLETLELKICDITKTNDRISEEKNAEITKLNDKIKSVEAEKNGYFTSLMEKDEQIQCLSMQMTTVKETCHCLQGELSSLQKTNNDLKNEIAILVEARNTALESLKVETKECSELNDKINELKKKYNICIEENCLLTSKIQNLETEVKNLQQGNADLLSKAENNEGNDFSILIHDNQKLQEEVNLLRKKNDNLKKSSTSIESKTTSGTELQTQDISEIRKENLELQQHLCSIESTNSILKQKHNLLEEEVRKLSEKIQFLEIEKQKQAVEMEAVLKEKLELKEEIKKLMSSLEELTGFKTGYEYALLHGAATESFRELPDAENIQNVDSKGILNSTSELSKNLSSDEMDESSKKTVQFKEAESGWGLEFGILVGGDINENSDAEKPEINEIKTSEEAELACLYEELKEEKDHLEQEIKILKIRLDDYSSVLQETLSDNESLKLALEKCQKEHSSLSSKEITYSSEKNSNLELEVIEKLPHTGKESETSVIGLQNQILSLSKKINLLEKENVDYCEKNSSLMKELDSLNTTIKNLSKISQDLEIQNKNISFHCNTLEKQNFEVSEKLKKKYEELNEFNSQLALLIIKIKEALQHKYNTNSSSPKKSEKQLSENMNLFKLLLADLIVTCENNSLKVKSLEDTLNDLLIKKQAVDEELLQIKELNQFLEDEARELRNEVEQIKTDHNSIFERTNDSYCGDPRSPNELYSIEEIDDDPPVDLVSSEISEPTVQQHCTDAEGKADDKINSENPAVTSTKVNISIQVNIPNDNSDDSVFHNIVTSKTEEQDNKSNIDISQNLKNVCEYKLVIEQLEAENSSLTGSLNAKIALIERIHSELDTQLEKVEELTKESEMKDGTITHYQNLSKMLREELDELNEVSITKSSFMKHMKNVLNELQNDRDKLKSDISSLNNFSNEVLSSIRNYLSATVYEYEEKVKFVTDRCSHMKEVFHFIMLQLGRVSKDFGLWLNILTRLNNKVETISFPLSDDDMNLLKQTFQSLDIEDLYEDMCSSDCCLVINYIKKLEIIKQELFSLIHSSFFNLYQSTLKELNEYKNSIVPDLESTVKSFEDKLSSSNKDIKEAVLLEQKVEQSDEEASVTQLKKQLADAEIKMTKYKQIALKLKKELQESKKQANEIRLEKEKFATQFSETQKELDKISSEQFHYVQNYQSLQNEYDKTQDELELQKEISKKLEMDLSSTLVELNSIKEKIVDMDSKLLKANNNIEIIESTKQEKEKLLSELESKLIVLESKKQEKVHKIEGLEADLKARIEQINNLVEENNNLKAQLQSSQKVENKKNLLDLEMADYERSILELNNKIQKKNDEISDLKQKLDCEIEKSQGLLEEIESTEKLKETEQKRADSLKKMLDKTKSELSVTKERETELLTKVSHLQMQLEIVVQQEENCKLQVSETSAEVQHLKEMLKTSFENHQRIVHTLESKISTQKQEILCAHKEVESIKQEFENYKIRVHSVLKHQKSTAPTLTPIEENVKEKLESMVDKLKMQVKQLSEKLSAVAMEYEALQEEHDTLLQRYNKAIEDREKKDTEWLAKLEELNAEKNKLRATQEELSSQHLLQNEMLVSTYKKQIKIMSDEHKRTVSELQKQLESADLEIARLQRDQQKAHGLPLTPTVQDNPISFDILSQERQEGEGSESIDGSDTPIRHLSLATIPTSGFLPFEKLLQSPHDELSTSASFISNQDNEKLLSDLNAANKKIEHLSEVLNESESTNLRLSEQVRVLKEEVRRLERNKEREQHAENLEYLKNVFIKFATLSPCSEKAMLIPVLTTMLKLSPAEQQQLKSISGDIDGDESSASGWGSYLHRWSGLA